MIEGGAAYYITRTSSPKFAPNWLDFKKAVSHTLSGNFVWDSVFQKIASEIESQKSKGTVSVHVYNPANAVFSLAKLYKDGKEEYLPALQMVISDGDRNELYLGTIIWDGSVYQKTAEDWIRSAYGSLDNYMINNHFHNTFEYEDKALAKLGLTPDLSDIARTIANLIRIGVISEISSDRARTWWAPSIGEQLIVLSPDGDLSKGKILPGLYSQGFPAPVTDQ
eukprot:gene27421-30306_t